MITKAQKNWLSVQLVRSSIMLLLLFVACNDRNKNDLAQIEVYSIKWEILTRRDLNANDVINWSGSKKNFKISDKNDLILISKRLGTLKLLPKYRDIDTRMVCILHYLNNEKDTLQLGGTQIVKYKNKIFDKDSILVELIEKSNHN